jgi:predicted Holliday junction resolvase-like endonuclease
VVIAALIGVVAGLGLGALVAFGALPRLVRSGAQRHFERWRAADRGRRVRSEVGDWRGSVKAELSDALAPRSAAFPFEAADARFLGHPAHFVVFAGHTEVADRGADEMAEVVFVTVGDDPAERADAALLDECLRDGRMRWATLRSDQTPDLGPDPTAKHRGVKPPGPTPSRPQLGP